MCSGWYGANPLLDAEGGESFRGFGLHGHVVDDGQAGTGAHPVHQSADIPIRALEDRFDPAVGQIAYPAGHAVLLGQPAAGVAEEDALHSAGNQHPIAHHKQTVRLDRRTGPGTGLGRSPGRA